MCTVFVTARGEEDQEQIDFSWIAVITEIIQSLKYLLGVFYVCHILECIYMLSQWF
jgi:recombinational DNA repair protein (RecF pathway)